MITAPIRFDSQGSQVLQGEACSALPHVGKIKFGTAFDMVNFPVCAVIRPVHRRRELLFNMGAQLIGVIQENAAGDRERFSATLAQQRGEPSSEVAKDAKSRIAFSRCLMQFVSTRIFPLFVCGVIPLVVCPSSSVVFVVPFECFLSEIRHSGIGIALLPRAILSKFSQAVSFVPTATILTHPFPGFRMCSPIVLICADQPLSIFLKIILIVPLFAFKRLTMFRINASAWAGFNILPARQADAVVSVAFTPRNLADDWHTPEELAGMIVPGGYVAWVREPPSLLENLRQLNQIHSSISAFASHLSQSVPSKRDRAKWISQLTNNPDLPREPERFERFRTWEGTAVDAGSSNKTATRLVLKPAGESLLLFSDSKNAGATRWRPVTLLRKVPDNEEVTRLDQVFADFSRIRKRLESSEAHAYGIMLRHLGKRRAWVFSPNTEAAFREALDEGVRLADQRLLLA